MIGSVPEGLVAFCLFWSEADAEKNGLITGLNITERIPLGAGG